MACLINEKSFIKSFSKVVDSVYTPGIDEFVKVIPSGWASFRGKESKILSELVNKSVGDIEFEAEECDLEMISYGRDETPTREGVFKTDLKLLNDVTNKIREIALHCETKDGNALFGEKKNPAKDGECENETVKICIAKMTLFIAARSVANIFCSKTSEDEDQDDDEEEEEVNMEHFFEKISCERDGPMISEGECIQRILFFFKRIAANDCNDANEVMHMCCDLINPEYNVDDYPFSPSFLLSLFDVDIVDADDEGEYSEDETDEDL